MDRNFGASIVQKRTPGSLSARRAWIEIGKCERYKIRMVKSLSARRAWIEINRARAEIAKRSGRSPQGERG